MARQIDCPSCGAAVKFRRGAVSAECRYCGNSVMIPPDMQGPPSEGPATSIGPPVTGCGKKITLLVAVATFIVMGVAFLVFFLARDMESKGSVSVQSLIQGGLSADLEFGGPGTGRGYFQDPECIAVDGNGNIYVGEFETGRIQIFDETGELLNQWFYGEPEEFYLLAMSADHSGDLYMVYNNELQIHNGLTGEYLGNLHHPDGWGFSDVDVAEDGAVVASWYCNRDDVVLFQGDKSALVIREAVSGVAGDSELATLVAAGNMGEIFAYGSFNSVMVQYDSQGTYLDRFGSDDIFTMPGGMDVDPTGRLWVSDFGDLLLFNSSGELLETIRTGKGINDFVIDSEFRLWGITLDDTVVMVDLSDY